MPSELPAWRRLLCRLWPLGLLVCIGPSAFAETYAVLYPEVGSPQRSLFEDITAGIRGRLRGAEVASLALPEDATAARLHDWLRGRAPKVAITLGRVATSAYSAVGYPAPQVIGALAISPQTRPSATGISLSPEPELLFATLQSLAPRIQRVFTVYNPERDQWLIDHALSSARRYGLELIALKASNLQESARHLLSILRQADPTTDSLWLPLDDALVNTANVLPFVVEQSWAKRLLVFSSNFVHTRLGVLFALYPNPRLLGRQLAEIALRVAADPADNPGIAPLGAVSRALNARVASHLGFTIDKATRAQFDLILQE